MAVLSFIFGRVLKLQRSSNDSCKVKQDLGIWLGRIKAIADWDMEERQEDKGSEEPQSKPQVRGVFF